MRISVRVAHHGRHRQRVAVEGADLVDLALGDPAHDLLGAADRAARQAAADRLGQAQQVGGDAEALGRAAVVDRGAGLDLVEGEQRAVRVQQVLDALQVAVVRRDDAGVHHARLDDHAGDPALVLLERALERVQVVERHDLRQVDEVGRQAQRLRHRDRMVVVADLVAGGRHRHHHGVVMAVVASPRS